MSSLTERSAREWLTAGEGSPAPPGASVAAYAGALGAALVLRAVGPGVADAARQEIERQVEILGGQIDPAARALRAVAQTPSAQTHRDAAEASLAVFDACFAVLEIIERLGALRPAAVPELAVGSDLVAAALEASAICVRVSLPAAADEGFSRPAKARLVSTLHEARRLRDRIRQAVEGRLVL